MGNLSGSPGIRLGLASPPADAGFHRAARRDLVKDGELVRFFAENAAQSLGMFARRAAPAQNNRDRSFRDIDAFIEHPGCDNGLVLPAFESPQNGFSFTSVRLVSDCRDEEKM